MFDPRDVLRWLRGVARIPGQAASRVARIPSWVLRLLLWSQLCRRGFHRCQWRTAMDGAYDELVCPTCLAQLATRPAAGSLDWANAMRELFPRRERPPGPLPSILADLLPTWQRGTRTAPANGDLSRTRAASSR